MKDSVFAEVVTIIMTLFGMFMAALVFVCADMRQTFWCIFFSAMLTGSAAISVYTIRNERGGMMWHE